MNTKQISTYELHPLCTLFPRMAGAEYSSLVSDIKDNGLRLPIILHKGMILDGGNRYSACIDADVSPVFEEFSGDNIVSFVLSANMHRRHLSAGQQAAIVASAQDWGKSQPQGGDRKSIKVQDCTLKTVEDRAAQSGASIRTQKSADKVAKANPALAVKVAHGEVSLPAALATVEGKKATPKAASKQPAAAESEYNFADDAVSELSSTVVSLSAENDALKDRLAVAVMDATPEEKTAAIETIESLRADVARLEIEVKALTASRNTYQQENYELKRQCAMQRKQLDKLRVAA